ncbi:MAG TPA: TIGR00159 family protein [Flavobacteriales bacterium]|nr:TIGR00159 family protein [Flavobacteriales bacterium]
MTPILAFELWEAISPFLTLGVQVLDLVLVGLIVFYVYRLTKGTSAIPVFLGLLAIYLIWKLVTLMGMRFMGEILGQFIAVGILAIIIVFQQELRQFLFSIGDRASLKEPPEWLLKLLPQRTQEGRKAFPVEEVVRALDRLSSRKEGALIIVQRESDLTHHIQSHTKLVADIYAPLIEAIFHKECSMHDGALYIAVGRVRGVRCILPVSQSQHLPVELGMRHRAALGLSEVTDALVWVVSEETGTISLAHEGELRRALHPNDCREIMHELLNPKQG